MSECAMQSAHVCATHDNLSSVWTKDWLIVYIGRAGFFGLSTAEEEPRLLEMMPILLTFKAVQHPTCLALVHLHDSSLLCVYPMIFVDASLLLQTFPFSRRGKCASPTYRQAPSGVLTWTTSTTRVHAGSQRQSTYVCSRPQSNLAG